MSGYDMFSVLGRRVLLTGAGGGIGKALLTAFLAAGASVAGVARSPDRELEKIKAAHDGCKILHCDLSDHPAVASLPDLAENELDGRIDVVIHNAWACPRTEPYSIENLRATTAVGLEAAYILYGNIAPRMAAGDVGGSIISIASINGMLAFPENPAYTSIKAALRLFTKTIALDFGVHGVRANNLCPGYTHTRMTAGSYADPERHEARRGRTMLGRWAEPEDMIGPCLFLASSASRYVTGTDLIVDGGWTAKGL